MRTIRQSANDYAYGKISTIVKNVDYERMYNAFLAGAEFAQRWISVDEELPTPENWVIIRCPSSEEDIPYIGEWEYDISMIIEMSREWSGDFKPTHWRYIDFNNL
jgi:hypothetical protein